MGGKAMKRAVFVAILWFVPAAAALAGPPFRTDDPVPVDYHHGEIYLFSTGTRDAGGTSGIGPALEFNYGILPDTQFHLIAPMAYNSPNGETSHFGYGDTEVGLKYRLVEQNTILPTIGIFPIIEIPTGDEDRGLGGGHTRVFLPLWLQRDFGKWSTYGGGGYWINPGPDNKNYWFTGIQLQYSFSEGFFLGAEFFYQTADTVDGTSSSGFNVGGGVPLVEKFQLLFTAGRGLKDTSSNRFSYYVGLYRAF
jgi:hypothetical protein